MLAQKARRLACTLILATQDRGVNVITGLIKRLSEPHCFESRRRSTAAPSSTVLRGSFIGERRHALHTAGQVRAAAHSRRFISSERNERLPNMYEARREARRTRLAATGPRAETPGESDILEPCARTRPPLLPPRMTPRNKTQRTAIALSRGR